MPDNCASGKEVSQKGNCVLKCKPGMVRLDSGRCGRQVDAEMIEKVTAKVNARISAKMNFRLNAAATADLPESPAPLRRVPANGSWNFFGARVPDKGGDDEDRDVEEDEEDHEKEREEEEKEEEEEVKKQPVTPRKKFSLDERTVMEPWTDAQTFAQTEQLFGANQKLRKDLDECHDSLVRCREELKLLKKRFNVK